MTPYNKIKPGCENCISCVDSVFSVFDKERLASLNHQKSYHVYKKGQFIFHEGNDPKGLYCINDGLVKVSKIGEDGREQIVRLAKPGNFLGYRALLCNESYHASAIALSDARICFFPKEFYLSLVTSDSDLASRTIQLLSADLRFAENMMMNMAQKHVKGRIAEVLLMLENFYGIYEKDQTINAIIKREDIGNIAGTTTETTIRVISELNKDGVLELLGKRIKILDRQRLQEISEEHNNSFKR